VGAKRYCMEVREGIAIGWFAEYVVRCWTLLEQDVKYVTEEIRTTYVDDSNCAPVALRQIRHAKLAQVVPSTGRQWSSRPWRWLLIFVPACTSPRVGQGFGSAKRKRRRRWAGDDTWPMARIL
ncbi:hypothetical protein BDP55DRAFT_687577, partial [Colletotrichum godetiae]